MPSEADQKTPCMPTRLGLPPTRRPCPRPSQRIGGKRDERVLLLRRRTCSMSGTAGLPRVGRARSRPLRPPASPGEGAISADRDDAIVLHREEPRPQGDCLRRDPVARIGDPARRFWPEGLIGRVAPKARFPPPNASGSRRSHYRIHVFAGVELACASATSGSAGSLRVITAADDRISQVQGAAVTWPCRPRPYRRCICTGPGPDV